MPRKTIKAAKDLVRVLLVFSGDMLLLGTLWPVGSFVINLSPPAWFQRWVSLFFAVFRLLFGFAFVGKTRETYGGRSGGSLIVFEVNVADRSSSRLVHQSPAILTQATICFADLDLRFLFLKHNSASTIILLHYNPFARFGVLNFELFQFFPTQSWVQLNQCRAIFGNDFQPLFIPGIFSRTWMDSITLWRIGFSFGNPALKTILVLHRSLLVLGLQTSDL
jgi:hypothetical protein